LIIDVYCGFKPVSFGVIHYTAIDHGYEEFALSSGLVGLGQSRIAQGTRRQEGLCRLEFSLFALSLSLFFLLSSN